MEKEMRQIYICGCWQKAKDALLTLLCALGFSILLGVLFGMICCVCNMYFKSGIGIAICAGFVVLERICMANGTNLGMKSPVGMLVNYLNIRMEDIAMTVIYYIFLISCLISIGIYCIRKMDIA